MPPYPSELSLRSPAPGPELASSGLFPRSAHRAVATSGKHRRRLEALFAGPPPISAVGPVSLPSRAWRTWKGRLHTSASIRLRHPLATPGGVFRIFAEHLLAHLQPLVIDGPG